MIKEVNSIEDANVCDKLLTELIRDERKYNDSLDEDIIVTNHFSEILKDKKHLFIRWLVCLRKVSKPGYRKELINRSN